MVHRGQWLDRLRWVLIRMLCQSECCVLIIITVVCCNVCLHCFDAVGWVAGRASSQWWGAGVVICLEWGAYLHMAQLMPLPLTVSCFSKIQIGFTFLVTAHPGGPGKRAVKWVYVYML